MKLMGQELNPYELEQIKIGGDFRKSKLVVGAIDGIITAGLVSAALIVSENQIAEIGSFIVLSIIFVFVISVWIMQRRVMNDALPFNPENYLIRVNPSLDWPFGPKARWWTMWDFSRYVLTLYAFFQADWTGSIILTVMAFALNILVMTDKARLTIRALSIDSYHAPLGPIDQDDL